MAYTDVNFKTKKALKEAVARGDSISVFRPNADIVGIGPYVADGTIAVEGPHYPKPHTWYAQVEVKEGRVVKVVS